MSSSRSCKGCLIAKMGLFQVSGLLEKSPASHGHDMHWNWKWKPCLLLHMHHLAGCIV